MAEPEFLDFPFEEYSERIAKTRRAMEQQGLDGMLLTARDGIEYLSGFRTVALNYPFKAFALILPLSGNPSLVMDAIHSGNAAMTSWVKDLCMWGRDRSYVETVAESVRDLKLHRVGVELGLGHRLNMSYADFQALTNKLSEVEFIDAANLLGKVRAVKSRLEMERILSGSRIACECLKRGFESMHKGMTEKDFLDSIIVDFIRHGADSGYYGGKGVIHVRSGDSVRIAPTPTQRRIRKGDLIRVDCGIGYQGYVASDVCRTFIFDGEASVLQRRRMEVLTEALSIVPKEVRPGFTSTDIYRKVMGVIREAGLEREMEVWGTSSAGGAHVIGHGFGFAVHEPPYIYDGETTRWEPGMIMAVELLLGEYEEEDDYLFTRNGCELLTPLEHRGQFRPGEEWRLI